MDRGRRGPRSGSSLLRDGLVRPGAGARSTGRATCFVLRCLRSVVEGSICPRGGAISSEHARSGVHGDHQPRLRVCGGPDAATAAAFPGIIGPISTRSSWRCRSTATADRCARRCGPVASPRQQPDPGVDRFAQAPFRSPGLRRRRSRHHQRRAIAEREARGLLDSWAILSAQTGSVRDLVLDDPRLPSFLAFYKASNEIRRRGQGRDPGQRRQAVCRNGEEMKRMPRPGRRSWPHGSDS